MEIDKHFKSPNRWLVFVTGWHVLERNRNGRLGHFGRSLTPVYTYSVWKSLKTCCPLGTAVGLRLPPACQCRHTVRSCFCSSSRTAERHELSRSALALRKALINISCWKSSSRWETALFWVDKRDWVSMEFVCRYWRPKMSQFQTTHTFSTNVTYYFWITDLFLFTLVKWCFQMVTLKG